MVFEDRNDRLTEIRALFQAINVWRLPWDRGRKNGKEGAYCKRHCGGRPGYRGIKGREDGVNGGVVKQDQGAWEEENI